MSCSFFCVSSTAFCFFHSSTALSWTSSNGGAPAATYSIARADPHVARRHGDADRLVGRAAAPRRIASVTLGPPKSGVALPLDRGLGRFLDVREQAERDRFGREVDRLALGDAVVHRLLPVDQRLVDLRLAARLVGDLFEGLRSARALGPEAQVGDLVVVVLGQFARNRCPQGAGTSRASGAGSSVSRRQPSSSGARALGLPFGGEQTLLRGQRVVPRLELGIRRHLRRRVGHAAGDVERDHVERVLLVVLFHASSS
jgi:hypothetical protein